MSKTIKVIIADDHALVRMGLLALLDTQPDIKTIGQAASGDEAVRKAIKLHPDVIVMDIMMPGTDGISATEALAKACPDVKVLILTTSTISDEINRALLGGALGIILKSEANRQLLVAIRTVAAGKRYVSPEACLLINQDPPTEALTPRQLEVLSGMVRGLSNKEIAMSLSCSPVTVKDRINSICAKLGAANRTEAVAIALRKQLLKI